MALVQAPSGKAFLTLSTHAQPCWGPQDPTPTQFPLTLGPQCQASPYSSHLVSGLLSVQQQLFLLWPQRITVWDPLPQPWVPKMPTIIPASVMTGSAKGTRAHVPASLHIPRSSFPHANLLSSLWPSTGPLRCLGWLPGGEEAGPGAPVPGGAAGGQGAAVEPPDMAAR